MLIVARVIAGLGFFMAGWGVGYGLFPGDPTRDMPGAEIAGIGLMMILGAMVMAPWWRDEP